MFFFRKPSPAVPLSRCASHTFRRHDPYLFFAEDVFTLPPVTVEIGSFTGDHAKKLYDAYHGTVIVYEAGRATFASLKQGLGATPAIAVNKAVTGNVGEVTFHEYTDKRSSNSIFDRKLEGGTAFTVATIGIEQIFDENKVDRIDAYFTNAEGAELGMLEEVLAKPAVWSRIRQMCVSFHKQIYGRKPIEKILKAMAPLAEIYEDDKSKWPCHLFINRNPRK